MMPLQVYTARVGTRDPDALQVTLWRNHDADGHAFAPSMMLLKWGLGHRRAGTATPDIEREYADRYRDEMRAGYRRDRAAWDALLARPRVVLLCFCPAGAFCHRRVLAGILTKLGAVDCGELDVPRRPDGEG